MPIQFYRKANDKNLYEQGTNRVIGATEFGLGTPNAGKGFQEIKQPVAPTIPTIPKLPATNNISSSDISNGMSISGATPPPKTADLVHETFVNNAQQFTQQQKDMFVILDQQRKDAQAKIDALNTQGADIAAGKTANAANYKNLAVSKPGMAYQDIQRQTAVDNLVNKGITDPNQILTELNKTGSYTLDQIQQNLQEHYNPTGFRQAMEEAGNKKYQLDEAYNQRKQLVDETIQLSQMMFNDLQAEKNRPGLLSVSQGRQANIKEDYIGRISLLQATTAAIDGNINLARTFIDRGIEAVNADRNDRINFLNFYNGLLEQKSLDNKTALLTATADEKKAITDEIGMLQGKITETENNKKFIQTLFTDTQTALTAIKAGVKATDTPEQATQKINEYVANNPDQFSNQDTTTDYKNWRLAGALEGTGKTFAEWVSSDKTKPPTEAELRNLGFYTRADTANTVLNNLDKWAADLNIIGQTWQNLAPDVLKTNNGKTYDQARRQFSEAYLRRDSGAVISPTEYASADKIYFVQPGDTDKIIAQKKKARETIINSLKIGSGNAVNQLNQPNGSDENWSW